MRIINSELNGAGRTSETATDLEKLNFKTELFAKNYSVVSLHFENIPGAFRQISECLYGISWKPFCLIHRGFYR